jgi:hypothetical protein
MTPHKGDVLCFPCEEAWRLARAQAAYAMAEAERLLQLERQKKAHMN